MFRLRIESRPAEWRSFRWTTYGLIAGIMPMAVAAAVSFGSPFGTDLLLILPLLWGLSIFGVEFTIHTANQAQITEFDAEGIHFTGPNLTPRTFRWGNLSRVQVRALGNRRAPSSLLFIFRERLLARFLPVDSEQTREAAERVAGFVARYAPRVRRTGRVDALRWDSSLALEGDATLAPRRFSPLYNGGTALCGSVFNLFLAEIAIAFGFVQSRQVGWGMAGAYFCLGAGLVCYNWRSEASARARTSAGKEKRAVNALLLSGGVIAGLQLLLPLFLLG